MQSSNRGENKNNPIIEEKLLTAMVLLLGCFIKKFFHVFV